MVRIRFIHIESLAIHEFQLFTYKRILHIITHVCYVHSKINKLHKLLHTLYHNDA